MSIPKHKYSIPREIRDIIGMRYRKITKSINREFWDLNDDIKHSLYVGSYGRNTAISSSDIDIIAILPDFEFDHYNNLKGNSQSRLLQAVKNAILLSYPNSDIRADGQVIKVQFSDGMKFEIVPAFKEYSGTFKYPNSNHGGMWLSTNPKAEQDAIKTKNSSSNGLLVDTCRHIRFIRDNYFSSYTLSGIVIDSFVYYAIANWHWLNPGEISIPNSQSYESVLLNYFINNIKYSSYIQAPGSGDFISCTKSIDGLEKVLGYIQS